MFVTNKPVRKNPNFIPINFNFNFTNALLNVKGKRKYKKLVTNLYKGHKQVHQQR